MSFPYPDTAQHSGAPRRSTRHPVEFTGLANEYFRIWIVNLALTVVTLGIFSAWAKVRRKRYFYGNTFIDDTPFDYHGQPLSILKGRIIAALLLSGGSFGAKSSTLLAILFTVVQVIGFPWLVVRSLAFNARYSSFRGLRFRFDGRWQVLLRIYLVWGLATVFTLGALYPSLKARLVAFRMEHHAWGATRASLGLLSRDFYRIYLVGAGLLAAALVALGLVAALLSMTSSQLPAFAIFTATILFYLIGVLEWAYLNTRITNAVWNALELGPVRFESRLRARELASIYVTNAIAVVLTLGLAVPWATIRTLRYRAESTTVIAYGGLEAFVGVNTPDESATGESIADLLDFDIGL